MLNNLIKDWIMNKNLGSAKSVILADNFHTVIQYSKVIDILIGDYVC